MQEKYTTKFTELHSCGHPKHEGVNAPNMHKGRAFRCDSQQGRFPNHLFRRSNPFGRSKGDLSRCARCASQKCKGTSAIHADKKVKNHGKRNSR